MSTYRIALNVLNSVLSDSSYLNLALKELPSSMRDSEKSFVGALCYTAIENLYYVDFIISHYAKSKQNRQIKNILRIGVTQILYMKTPQSAVCNECVKLCREIGKNALCGFVNGILRNACREFEANTLPKLPEKIDERLSIQYSYPQFLVREYIDRFGENETEKLLKATDFGLSVRVQYPYTSAEFIEYLDKQGIEYRRREYATDVFSIQKLGDITKNELFSDGKITVQSESSAIATLACGVTPGMSVLDACASPGGKSAYLSALMYGEGEIIACDIHAHRCELTKNTTERLHANNVAVKLCDSSVFDESLSERFDVVLVDAPCSGFGVFGKPDIKIRRTESEINELALLQLSILSNCAKYVKKGGALCYSTCTVSKRENENIIEAFLAQNSDFACRGLENHICEQLIPDIVDGKLILLPHKHETDGFFIARLERAK